MKDIEISVSLPIEVQNINELTEKVEDLLSLLKKTSSLIDELASFDLNIVVGKKI